MLFFSQGQTSQILKPKVENNFSRGKNTCIFVDVVQVQGEGHAPSQH